MDEKAASWESWSQAAEGKGSEKMKDGLGVSVLEQLGLTCGGRLHGKHVRAALHLHSAHVGGLVQMREHYMRAPTPHRRHSVRDKTKLSCK